MMVMNRRRFLGKALLAAGVVGPVGGSGIYYAVATPGDLSRLAPFHAKYNNEKLVADLMGQEGDRDTYTFVVFGDSRNNRFFAEEIFRRAMTEKPTLCFHTGDLVRGGTVQEYLDNHLPLLEISDPVPVFCVPGNHERGDRHDFAAYEAIYGGTRFSFDYGPCRFVGLNVSEKVCVTKSDLEFMDTELGKPGATHKFVYFHVPPLYFEAEIVERARRGFTWNAEEFREILKRHKVNEVFMAHIHGYATVMLDDVRYTLTAGAGAPLSKRLSEENRVYNYVVLKVGPDGVHQEVVYFDPKKEAWLRRAVY